MKNTSNYFWQINVSTFIFIITVLNLLIYHVPLYSFIASNLDYQSMHGILTILTVLTVIIIFTFTLLGLLAIIAPFLLKPFSIIAALLSAAALYFITTYNIILDKSLIESILYTRSTEAISYLHPKLFLFIFLFGLIPSWLIIKTKVKKVRRLRLITHIVIVLLMGLGFIYANGGSWLWIDKNAKHLGGKIMPWSYIGNTARYFSDKQKGSKIQELLPAATLKNDDKMIVILVIGETARSQNFSLYGYDRETNPLLKKADVVTLNNPSSCSTYTTASVRCMLSHTGSDSDAFEPLPSYLQRHDVDVIWRTRNWGEPTLKIQSYLSRKELKPDCNGEGCEHDEVLLSNLEAQIKASTKNKIFIVLHTSGSHGPSYYSKYPKRFEVFKPVCKSVALDKCTSQELLNAYDNTILYTDYFLNKTIGILKNISSKPSTLLYMSDHGESLGEYGLYLHGTPFSIAPDVQKKVPFILWMSDEFKADKGISSTSFKQDDEYSHSNIFHSVLGAFDIESAVYNKELDIFKGNSIK
ncbi:MAG: phosphoethanolamine--lipid A transferase EptA [Cocleimonas sp.]